ncbi:MAG: ABC transporter transmembrane domain-containing protein [Candidatus Gastranaerophilaceae bacterium]|nr:ABC transporter transmembrane domain-containing protein [Candidatus Gastranaerophilaceae bacterium]
MSLKSLLAEKIANLKNLRFVVNYRRMWPYVKPVWFRALCSMLICIPIGSLDAVIALALKPYMDLVMVDKSIQSPWYIPLGIVAFTSIQGGLKYMSSYLATWVGSKITNALKYDLYKKLLTFPTEFYDKRNSGDVIFQFNNMADSACVGLLDNLSVFTQRIFSSISLVCVLFYNSWQLALIAVVVLGCAFAPVAKIQKRIKSVMEKTVVADSAIITAYNETFAGNKTITSYNLEEHEINRFQWILKNIFTLRIKMVQKTQWLSPMMHVIVSVGIAAAIGYGSHLILTNQITSGNFVSFITALILLYTPVKNIGNNLNAVQFSFFAIETIFEQLDTKPSIADKEDAIELNSSDLNIEFKDVNFEYVENVPVLKNINLSVKKGQTIAFVGNSGGGKTTMVNLLPRFYDIKSGSITIDGIDIRDYTLHSLRQNIAVVFQDNFLFSGTIRENIMLGRENASEEELMKAVDMAYLTDFINSLEKGLDTEIGERGILLSGGQKQRVAIARAFLKDAPIIILDEATSALDNKAEAIVQKAIDNLMKDKTVFVIAHRLSTIQNADLIAVINQGEIVERGTHEQLLNIEGGAYKALYDMQFKKQENQPEIV